MLTFDGVWHFGEVFSSRMNPGFHCTGQMAVYGSVRPGPLAQSVEHETLNLMVVGSSPTLVSRFG